MPARPLCLLSVANRLEQLAVAQLADGADVEQRAKFFGYASHTVPVSARVGSPPDGLPARIQVMYRRVGESSEFLENRWVREPPVVERFSHSLRIRIVHLLSRLAEWPGKRLLFLR